MDNISTGNLIKKLRKDKNLTQLELANMIGVTDKAVSKWERGLGCPDISLLTTVSEVLEISILELLKGKELDENQIVSNENIIHSMKYSENITKEKNKKSILKFLQFFLIIIVTLTSYLNFKTTFYNYKSYSDKSYNMNEKVIAGISEISNNLKLIEENQGIFTDTEHKIIITQLNKLIKNANFEDDIIFTKKKRIKLADSLPYMQKILDCSDNTVPEYNLSPIYKILSKYDSSSFEHFQNSIKFGSLSNHKLHEAGDIYTDSKQLGNKIDNKFSALLKGHIAFKIYTIKTTIEKVIEVGELNEK